MIDWLIVGCLASISKPSMYMQAENEFNPINKIYTSGWGKQIAGEREQLPWNLFFLTNKHTRILNCLLICTSISFPIVNCPFLSYNMHWCCTKYRTEWKYKLHCIYYPWFTSYHISDLLIESISERKSIDENTRNTIRSILVARHLHPHLKRRKTSKSKAL